MQKRYLVFTDLDGTLLDHHTYAYQAALPALERLRDNGTPVIAVSSKTRLEIEPLLDVPAFAKVFVTENGSGVFVAPESGLRLPPGAREKGGYKVMQLGVPYDRVVQALRAAAQGCPGRIRGFSDLSTAEVAALTGLSHGEASRAKRREFSEPFLYDGDEAGLTCLEAALSGAGLRCLRGGRFLHALGACDKGNAVRLLLSIYQASYPMLSWTTVGLGDSLNDLALLGAVDLPVVVMRPGGDYMELPEPLAARVLRAPGIGPVGWNAAMLRLLDERE